MKPSPAPDGSPAQLAELFADRERLTGQARERFLELLNQTLVPMLTRSRRHWLLAGLLAVTFTPLSVGAFRLAHRTWPPEWFTVGCLAYSLIGLACALGYRRARDLSRGDVEVNWATYCTLFRPALLEIAPGLLDHNLPEDCRERVVVRPKRASSLRELWRDRDEEFWSAGFTGLGLGGLLLAAGGILGVATPAWLLLPLPVAGATLLIWIRRNRRALAREAGDSGRPHRNPTDRNELGR